MAINPEQNDTSVKHVYYFATCVIDQFFPQAGLDGMTLLANLGVTVHFPEDQTCCGQPAYTSGYRKEAQQVAKAQLDLFPENWPIVVPSGSCAAMMKHEYSKLFADDPAMLVKVNALSPRVYELTEFLVDVLHFSLADLGTPQKVALHTSCSARREMHTLRTGRQLLAGLTDVNVLTQSHESECCGFGGTFCLKGVMSVEDARRAVDIGATAIMLSNHGGRQLDGSRAPFDQLAEIMDAVGDRIEVICDGGVIRSTDLPRALQTAGRTPALPAPAPSPATWPPDPLTPAAARATP